MFLNFDQADPRESQEVFYFKIQISYIQPTLWVILVQLRCFFALSACVCNYADLSPERSQEVFSTFSFGVCTSTVLFHKQTSDCTSFRCFSLCIWPSWLAQKSGGVFTSDLVPCTFNLIFHKQSVVYTSFRVLSPCIEQNWPDKDSGGIYTYSVPN